MGSWRLTATEALNKIKAQELTTEQYASSLLARIKERDGDIGAWVHIDPNTVLEQARALDKVPLDKRGPLHGLPVAVKDVIYTKGKTTTTEFAATMVGTQTRNPHNVLRTPGGSSSGSAAAVADFQIPVSLGTQTGGSIVRPASFNGIYGFKPTWNAITREGQKVSSLTLDTLGFFARSVDDFEPLADTFALHDDDVSTFTDIKSARFAVCKTAQWKYAGEGTQAAMAKAADLLKDHGAQVEDVSLGPEFDSMAEWHRIINRSEGRSSFLPEYLSSKEQMNKSIAGFIEDKLSRKEQLEAYDGIAALRPRFDAIASQYTAFIVPSVPDEAPTGLESTGNLIFNGTWTALHVPVMNVPGFRGPNDMPVGISVVVPRFQDRHLLKVSKALGQVFEAEGGWNQGSTRAE
ncbi:hypothetical protein FZEAL_9442 [Fusarium zealandicum]|uniref:Amidase domain-containing protein n=1 Tax=Fusarium zealandicum TaxID=1053134 RepID=A0A8H4UAU8_9HYPO|nr:hypothetical protein FZEAL_9442 [Fusarium zealandicum]